MRKPAIAAGFLLGILLAGRAGSELFYWWEYLFIIGIQSKNNHS
tara:strand:+ start:1957 stop:2088 length:132 start_codon:yes stop_codon:yes gene_type:complete